MRKIMTKTDGHATYANRSPKSILSRNTNRLSCVPGHLRALPCCTAIRSDHKPGCHLRDTFVRSSRTIVRWDKSRKAPQLERSPRHARYFGLLNSHSIRPAELLPAH